MTAVTAFGCEKFGIQSLTFFSLFVLSKTVENENLT